MPKSFIFMQASLKMSAVLNCYEVEKAKGRDVSIILPFYLRNIQFFIEDLHLNACVFILDRIVGRHPLRYSLFYKRRIKNFLTQIGVDDNTHFFFTDVNDDNIGFLLPFLKKCNPTQILSIQDIIDGENYQKGYLSSNVKQTVIAKLLSFFYNTHFIPVNECGFEQLWTDYKACHLPMIDYSDMSIINKYRIKVTDTPNSVVFYTSPYLNTLYEKEEYDKINLEIIDVLHQKGYKVFVKNHPAAGYPEVIKGLADEFIPSYIPGEFLELTTFNFAIGFLSTTLATAGKIIPSYSVLNIGNVKDVKLRDGYVKYLSDFNSNIVFLNSLEQIPSLV